MFFQWSLRTKTFTWEELAAVRRGSALKATSEPLLGECHRPRDNVFLPNKYGKMACEMLAPARVDPSWICPS
jgi:hypothetical protein